MKVRHLIIALTFFILSGCNPTQKNDAASKAMSMIHSFSDENLKFGLDFNQYFVITDKVRKNQVLSDILIPYHVTYSTIDQLVKNTIEVFDTRKIRPGKFYHILCSPDDPEKAEYFIYEKSKKDYVVFEIDSEVKAWLGEKDTETEIREVSGVINSSLYQTLIDQNLSAELAMELADMYAWSIDFYRINKGDYFQVIYEEYFIEGESIGIG